MSDWGACASNPQVRELLDAGIYDVAQLASGGWLDGLKYEDELIDDLKKRTAPDDKPEKPLRKVPYGCFHWSGSSRSAMYMRDGMLVCCGL